MKTYKYLSKRFAEERYCPPDYNGGMCAEGGVDCKRCWMAWFYDENEPTNADIIRTYSDTELAEWISSKMSCTKCPIDNCRGGHQNCSDIWMDWLLTAAIGSDNNRIKH